LLSPSPSHHGLLRPCAQVTRMAVVVTIRTENPAARRPAVAGGFMHDRLAPLYPHHLAIVRERADRALALGGFDHLLIAAGTPLGKFLDDQDYLFVANPHFRHWLPLTDAPGSWITYTPGSKPKLVFVQPRDYWHVVPEVPHGYWVEHFDIVTVRSAAEAVAQLPNGRGAVLAPACPAIDGVTVNNPQAVLDY